MRMEYIGLSELSGSLIALQGVEDVAYDEMAEITLESGERRYGRVIMIDGDKVILQVFEGTKGISLENARTHFTGKPMDIALSHEMLGRIFDGAGRPIDGLGEIYPEQRRNINGAAINPVSRQYPRSCIYTGISAIDGCSTLIRGQKLPIFSGSGMKHNELAAQIVRQARVGDQERHRRVLPPQLRGGRRPPAGGHVHEPGLRPHHRAYPDPPLRPHRRGVSGL